MRTRHGEVDIGNREQLKAEKVADKLKKPIAVVPATPPVSP